MSKVKVGDQIRIIKIESKLLGNLPSYMLGKVFTVLKTPSPYSYETIEFEEELCSWKATPDMFTVVAPKQEVPFKYTGEYIPGSSQDVPPSTSYLGPTIPGNTSSPMREFPTGATRSSDAGKPSYLKYISHPVWVRYGEYMLEHETQADGKIREAGNWQKGMPPREALESLARHMTDTWGHLDGTQELFAEEYEDALCAIIFNAVVMLHEQLKPDLKLEMKGPLDKQPCT